MPVIAFAQTKKYHKEITRYKNNKKKEQKIYREGKLAEWSGWFENGNTKFIRTYKDLKRNGVFKEWYENGNIKFQEVYRSDTISDTASYYYVSGRLEYQKIYMFGDVIEEVHWFEKGQKDWEERINRSNNSKTKVVYEYYPSNSIKSETVYNNGVIMKKVNWYLSGKKQSEAFYENGKLEGDFIEWYENGNIKCKTNYSAGSPKKIENWNEKGQKENVRVVTDQKPDSLKQKVKK